MAIEAKLVTITNEVTVQGRPLTLSMKIEDGKCDLVRMSFNGRGEIFAFPAEAFPAIASLIAKTRTEVESAKEALASTN